MEALTGAAAAAHVRTGLDPVFAFDKSAVPSEG